MIRLLIIILNLLLIASLSHLFLATSGTGRGVLASHPALAFNQGAGDRHAPETAERSSVVARSSPLYAKAYFTRGLAFQRAADASVSTSVIEHALHLDPRMAEARLWMAMRHLENGQPSRAIDHLVVVHRLRSTLAHQIAAIMAEAAKDRQARLMIAERLRDTRLILEILRHASADLGASDLRELISATDLSRLKNGVNLAQQAIVRSSIERDDYATAFAHWRALLTDAQPVNPVFNGDFEDIEASPPFNWTIATGAEVDYRRLRLTTKGHATGLEMISYSTSPMTLAEQTILLRPGAYVLRGLMRSGSKNKLAFAWRVRCRNGLVLSDATIPATRPWQIHDLPFEIPPDCLQQKVQIVSRGVAGAQGDSLQITGVSIDTAT